MHRFWPLLVAIGFGASMLLVSPGVSPAGAEAADCQFVFGFQTLHDLAPDVVGGCLANVHYNSANGDGQQETANGMMVWRKADNFTAFTDGYHTWVNGPNGVQERLNTERFDWESDLASAATAAAPAGTTASASASAPTDGETTAPPDWTPPPSSTTMASCTGNDHYITQLVDGGAEIRLEDNSLWSIMPAEKLSTLLWSEGDAITLTDDGIEDANYPCYLADESTGLSANAQPVQ